MPQFDTELWISIAQVGAIAFLFGILLNRAATGPTGQNAVQRWLVITGGTIGISTLWLLVFGFGRWSTATAGAAATVAVIGTSAMLLRGQARRSRRATKQALSRERALLAARLGESEGLYRAISDVASDGIVITQDMQVLFANRAAAHLVGVESPEALLGRDVMEFIAPEAGAMVRERMAQLNSGHAAEAMLTRFLRADGSPFDAEVSAAPFVLKGRPAIVSIIRDVSARQAMEDTVHRSEARFRALTELSSDWYWEQDADYRVTFMSDRYSAKTGLKMKNTLGQTRFETDNIWESETQKRVHRDDLDARRPFQNLRLSRLSEDGELKHFSISGRPSFDDEGKFVGYYGIGRDITDQVCTDLALRESEARFRSLTELSSDWYWEQDEALRFTERCSEGIEKSGFARSKMVGRRRSELPYYSHMTEEDWEPLQTAITRREPFREIVMRARNEHDELRYLSISGAPVFRSDGSFCGYRGVGRDVTDSEQQHEKLKLFRVALEASPDALFITNIRTMQHLDVNATACRMLGYTREELLELKPYDLTPTLNRDDFDRRYGEARAAGPDGFSTELHDRFMQRKDGSQVPVEVYRRYLKLRDLEIVVSVIRDISARMAADQALRLRDRALDSSVNAVVITRAGGDFEVEYVNPAFEHLTGYKAAEAIGRNMRFLRGEDDEQPDLARLRNALREGAECAVLLRNYAKDGTLFWNDLRIAPVRNRANRVTHFVGVLNDITAAKRYQDELAYQATHDALTAIPNRNLLEDRLEQALAAARRHERTFAVVFIDLDHFKHINDGLGHKVGDAVLKEMAKRLKACIREGDTLSRYAGDEFVVILDELSSEEAIGEAMLRLRHAVSQPIVVEGHDLIVTCSMGASVYPRDGDTPEDLLRHADAAMYQTKEEGRDGYRFFTPDLYQQSQNRLEIEARLRRALDSREFFLEYQPKVSLADGQVSGVEALIRWRHPELGIVPPTQFIPLAEETGLIVTIGIWVLQEACAQIARWRRIHGLEVAVAVNLSARQFRQKDLLSVIRAALDAHEVPPSLLQMEVTESGMLHDIPAATTVLNALRESGVHVSLDDFGTGYSSLSYLKRLPIDSVKIDRTFVRDVTIDPDDTQIVRAILGLAKALNLKTIAEGVESPEQVEFLRSHGCEEAQGFLYTKPLPASALTRWLVEHRNGTEGREKEKADLEER